MASTLFEQFNELVKCMHEASDDTQRSKLLVDFVACNHFSKEVVDARNREQRTRDTVKRNHAEERSDAESAKLLLADAITGLREAAAGRFLEDNKLDEALATTSSLDWAFERSREEGIRVAGSDDANRSAERPGAVENLGHWLALGAFGFVAAVSSLLSFLEWRGGGSAALVALTVLAAVVCIALLAWFAQRWWRSSTHTFNAQVARDFALIVSPPWKVLGKIYEQLVPDSKGFGAFKAPTVAAGSEAQPVTWKPLQPGQAKLLLVADGEISLDIGASAFDATTNPDALGALCFAYGLDNELFPLERVEGSGFLYVAWHFCALISRGDADPGLPSMVLRGLTEAIELALTEDLKLELYRRFVARLALVEAELDARRSPEASQEGEP